MKGAFLLEKEGRGAKRAGVEKGMASTWLAEVEVHVILSRARQAAPLYPVSSPLQQVPPWQPDLGHVYSNGFSTHVKILRMVFLKFPRRL